MIIPFRSLIGEGQQRFSRLLASRYWWAPLVLVTGAIQTAATVRALQRPYPLAVGVDQALYQHAGWYMLQGAIPYIHIWNPEPPLSMYLSTVLAFITGGKVLALHISSMVVTGVVAIATSFLIALLVVELTGNRLAGTNGGLVMYTFVGYYNLATLGFGFKHMTLLLGLAGLWLALRRHPYLSGVAVTASFAIWLPSAIFPVLALGILWRRSGWRTVLPALMVMLATTTVILIPIALWRAIGDMLQQSIVAPLLVTENQTLAVRLKKGVRFLGFSGLFVVVAVIWAVYSLRNGKWQYWWIYLGGAYFAGLVLFLDFDSFPDLFPGLTFVAITVGAFFSEATLRWRRYLAYFLVGAILLGPVVRIQLRQTENVSVPPARTAVSDEVQLPSMQEIYWEKIKPDTCHYRLSGTERQWIEAMKQRGRSVECSGLE